MPFVNGSRLLVQPGMTGATGNVYTGLHELEEMAFLLHFLRPEDQFVDVGANVGSYTVLASAAIGAATVAFEPIPSTFEHLLANVRLNAIEQRVRSRNVGVGAEAGTLRFSTENDTTNRVLMGEPSVAGEASVPVIRLDDEVELAPCLMKVDVEGFETAVMAGARDLLRQPTLRALIVELIGQGASYGYDERALRRDLEAQGFEACRYDPFSRRLDVVGPECQEQGNAIFVRDPTRAQERLAAAPRFTVLERSV